MVRRRKVLDGGSQEVARPPAAGNASHPAEGKRMDLLTCGRRVTPRSLAAKEKGDCMLLDKHRLTLGLLIVALAAFMLGCTAHAQPSKTETTLANVAKDLVIPVEAEHKKNPVPDTEEVVKQGR